MLMKTRQHLTVALCFARLAIQKQLEYPSFLVSWFLMIPIQYFAGIWMLKILVQRFDSLNGWTFPQIAFIYGLGLLSHGLQVVFFIQTRFIEGMVINGEFDRMLLRPMNVFFQFSVNYINFIGFIDMIPGIIIFVYACKMVGFQWSLANILKLLIVIFGATLIRCAIYTVTGSIAFWTKRSFSLVALNLVLLERTTMYPLSIYPSVLQILFTFILPVGFICFYPACEFLGQNSNFSFPIGLALWSPLVGVLTFMLAHSFFKLGLIKKYESSGS